MCVCVRVSITEAETVRMLPMLYSRPPYCPSVRPSVDFFVDKFLLLTIITINDTSMNYGQNFCLQYYATLMR